MPFVPHPCAEFPNDNPDLHDGASWVCGWTRAQPRAVLSARGMARMSAVPPASASGEILAEGSPALSKGVEAKVLAPLGAVERTEEPLESDVRLVVPETDAAHTAAATAVGTAAQAMAEDVRVAPTPIDDNDEEGILPTAEASVSPADVITDVESYFEEWDRKSSSKPRERVACAAEAEKTASSLDATSIPADDTAASTPQRDVATFALISEPFTPPGAIEGAGAATESETQAAAGVRASFTPKDDQDLQTAFGRFLGVDADEPSEDLSALISATREPVQTGLRPEASNGVPIDNAAPQLELDLVRGTKQLELTLHAPPSATSATFDSSKVSTLRQVPPHAEMSTVNVETASAAVESHSNNAPDALICALDSLDDAFDEPIAFTPSAPAVDVQVVSAGDEPIEFTPSAPAADVQVVSADEETVAPSASALGPRAAIAATNQTHRAPSCEQTCSDVAPKSALTRLERSFRGETSLWQADRCSGDLETMHAALAAFDEPIAFTPSPPVAEVNERIELTPSAAIADALAAEAELVNAEAELLADDSEEAVPEGEFVDAPSAAEASHDAASSALDDQREEGAHDEAIVEAVAALDDLFDTDETDWHTPVSQVAVRHEEKANWESPPHEDAFDDPEADIATRRLVLAEDEADEEDADEETISLSLTRRDESNATDAGPSPDQAEAGSDSFRVPRPEAFKDGNDDYGNAASLEPLSLELTPPPPGVGGWDRLVDFVAGFLLVRSATRAAALLPELLEGRRVNLSRLPEDTLAALCAEGIAARKPDGTFPTAAFRQRANALHLDFMSGRAPAHDLTEWLSGAVRALLGNTVSPAAARAHLEQAGIAKLLQRAA